MGLWFRRQSQPARKGGNTAGPRPPSLETPDGTAGWPLAGIWDLGSQGVPVTSELTRLVFRA